MYSAFREHLAYFIGIRAEYNNLYRQVLRDLLPEPLPSSLMDDAIKVGKDSADRKMYIENSAVVMMVGGNQCRRFPCGDQKARI